MLGVLGNPEVLDDHTLRTTHRPARRGSSDRWCTGTSLVIMGANAPPCARLSAKWTAGLATGFGSPS